MKNLILTNPYLKNVFKIERKIKSINSVNQYRIFLKTLFKAALNKPIFVLHKMRCYILSLSS
jgi:hypothetical protein